MDRHTPNTLQTTYINVMEALVAEEVNRQLKTLPERMLKYVKRAEIETFALSRLPALYASSQAGLQHQENRAKEFEPEITRVVRQALIAVQADPLRVSQPITCDASNPEAEAVLKELRTVLETPDLTWLGALKEIQTLEKLLECPRSERPQGTRPVSEAHGAVPFPPNQTGPSLFRRPGLCGSYQPYQPRANQG